MKKVTIEDNPMEDFSLFSITNFTDFREFTLRNVDLSKFTTPVLNPREPHPTFSHLVATNCRLNNLKMFPNFARFLPALQQLNLEGNDLESLADVEFSEKLELINLAHNRFKAVDPDTMPFVYASLPELKNLDLSYNPLVSFEAKDVPSSLWSLGLRSTQLHNFSFMDLERRNPGADPLRPKLNVAIVLTNLSCTCQQAASLLRAKAFRLACELDVPLSCVQCEERKLTDFFSTGNYELKHFLDSDLCNEPYVPDWLPSKVELVAFEAKKKAEMLVPKEEVARLKEWKNGHVIAVLILVAVVIASVLWVVNVKIALAKATGEPKLATSGNENLA